MDAVGTAQLQNANLTSKEQALLKFVKLLVEKPAETKDSDITALREAGWTDQQIWEACVEVGIFSFLNRMADAFGLDYPTRGWMPPKLREKLENEKREKAKATDTP